MDRRQGSQSGVGVSAHTAHFDDCGCKSAAYEKRIAELEAAREQEVVGAVRFALCCPFDESEYPTTESKVEYVMRDVRADWEQKP